MRDSTFSYKLLHDVKLTQSRSYVLFSRKVHYLAHFLKTLVYILCIELETLSKFNYKNW